MDIIITFIMLTSSGLFAGGVLTIAWSRLPAWKDMELSAFKTDFGSTLRVADRLQPILLVLAILTIGVFSSGRSGTEQLFALIAVSGFIITLLASVIVLVPLQKRILRSKENVTSLYAKWQQGHIGRTALSLLSFSILVISCALSVTR